MHPTAFFQLIFLFLHFFMHLHPGRKLCPSIFDLRFSLYSILPLLYFLLLCPLSLKLYLNILRNLSSLERYMILHCKRYAILRRRRILLSFFLLSLLSQVEGERSLLRFQNGLRIFFNFFSSQSLSLNHCFEPRVSNIWWRLFMFELI